jgi:hypothetical protein
MATDVERKAALRELRALIAAWIIDDYLAELQEAAQESTPAAAPPSTEQKVRRVQLRKAAS